LVETIAQILAASLRAIVGGSGLSDRKKEVAKRRMDVPLRQPCARAGWGAHRYERSSERCAQKI